MKKQSALGKTSRILLFVSVLVLLVVVKLPMWRIDLSAPQYPEGLKLLIYPGHLGGNVDIVNGLNHYIGMKALHAEDFVEFRVLPGIIIAFSVPLLLTALTGRRWMLAAVFILFLVFGVVAMADFWRWEYNYGHNLNPEAPIIVPGMAYQPPLIGYKQLLNFGAYSIPAIGGWLFAGVGLTLLWLNINEWRAEKKMKSAAHIPVPVVMILLLVFFSSCQTGVQPITVGKDRCSYCKMPISDTRFGGELVTSKGKVYKFDDAHCLLSFLRSADDIVRQQGELYFVDYSGSHALIHAATAFYLKSDALRSPMNGNIAAFQSTDSLNRVAGEYPGAVLYWNELNKP